MLIVKSINRFIENIRGPDLCVLHNGYLKKMLIKIDVNIKVKNECTINFQQKDQS